MGAIRRRVNAIRAHYHFWNRLLRRLERTTDEVFFLQVGAMDGRSWDPIHHMVMRCGWRGLLLEPLPDNFERLRRTYAGRNDLILENVALSHEAGTRDLYRIDRRAVRDGLVPDWAAGIASFYPDRNILGAKGAPIEDYEMIRDYIVRESVACVTLEELVERHAIEKIDLVQIDAEGYDYQALRQIDFHRFAPRVIRFEWTNLPPDEQVAAFDLLGGAGYRTRPHDFDMVAWKWR